MIRAILVTLCVILCCVPTLSAQEKFLGKTANEWAVQLKQSNDAKQRRNAAFAMGKMGRRVSTAITDLKIAYLQEKDAKVKDAIVFGLGEICRDVKAVYNTEKNPNVREALSQVFGEVCLGAGAEDHSLERIFLAAIAENDPPLRRSAAFALGCLASRSDAARQALDNA